MEIPKHIGIIMDGNRRWAKEHDTAVRNGHLEGQKNVRRIAKAAFEQGVQYVTVYAFSTENWQRATEEVQYLMRLLVRGLEAYIDEMHEAGIRIVFLGERNDLQKSVAQAIERSEQKTAQNEKGTLAICFNYGGQQEIVSSVQSIVSQGVAPADITSELISEYIYEPSLPSVDLVIRTSGEQRLSNFMLWRTAYSELYFTDRYWPDFSPEDLQAAIDEYQRRKRRFGA